MGPLREKPAPFVLGLTGPIACGKTTVGNMLLQLGALERIDADHLVHDLMRPATETTHNIARRFGKDVIAADGGVDRKRLAALVFSDRGALRDLEAITHPAVGLLIRERITARAGQNGVVILDAVKLLEGTLVNLCSAIWVVRCPRDEELRRLLGDRGMSERDALGRLAAQPDFRHPAVTRIIENAGTLEDLERAVRAARTTLPYS